MRKLPKPKKRISIFYTFEELDLCEECSVETDEFTNADCWENVLDNNLYCSICKCKIEPTEKENQS